MNKTLMRATTAAVALASGLSMAGTAMASTPADHAQAVLRLRQHVQMLKEQREAPPAPRAAAVVIPEIPVAPWWRAPVPASFSPRAAPRPDGRVVRVQADNPMVDANRTVSRSRDTLSRADGVVPIEPERGQSVLTKPGTLVIEPALEFQHTDINRFVVGGVAILDTVLVGSIEATQADRDSVTASLGLRYGVTDRFEVEVRVPYMYRSDTTTNTVVNSSNVAATTDLDTYDFGDVEGAVHWQMNEGQNNWPFMVANLRVKSTTGKGPFDVERNAAGIEQELATGSGFWGVEPSLTFIAPSDPAVFYANLGYLWNVKDDIGKSVANNRFLETVDPGDAIRFGVGMGLALNDKVSFSVGYQHDWIMQSSITYTDGTFESESLSVGSLTLGANWQMSDRAALNFSVGIGVTEDAPDVRMMARMPIAIDLFGGG